MAAFNQLTIIGNVGRAPEMRYVPSGKPVTSFSVAVTRKKGSGEDAEKVTQWFNISCWERLAEFANEYIAKGRQVAVVGPVELHTYTTQEGVERSSMQVTAREIQLLGSRADGEGQQEKPASTDLALESMPF